MSVVQSQLDGRRRMFCITNASCASPIEPNADDDDDDDDDYQPCDWGCSGCVAMIIIVNDECRHLLERLGMRSDDYHMCWRC